MPEKEKPPAMRVDIYLRPLHNKKRLSRVGNAHLPALDSLFLLCLCSGYETFRGINESYVAGFIQIFPYPS